LEPHVSLGDYLIKRILAGGVRHVFGMPGDYVLRFFKAPEDSPLQVVNTADEQGAAFAADAYARLNGLKVANTEECPNKEKGPRRTPFHPLRWAEAHLRFPAYLKSAMIASIAVLRVPAASSPASTK
jgi:hypothetical protein